MFLLWAEKISNLKELLLGFLCATGFRFFASRQNAFPALFELSSLKVFLGLETAESVTQTHASGTKGMSPPPGAGRWKGATRLAQVHLPAVSCFLTRWRLEFSCAERTLT